MASLVTPRNDKLLQQYLDLRFKAFQEPRFPSVLYVLQASLSFDALLTFWDNNPMQATFDGDTAFLEERLIFLESLYNYIIGDDLSALQLPSDDEFHLAFLTKQFIRSTCKSLQDVTLARVPTSCVLEAYRLQIGEPDEQIHRLCRHLPSFTDPCLKSQGDDIQRQCFARISKICGDDAASLQSVKNLVSRFWQVTDPVIGMLLLECLLLRAALRRPGFGWISSWFRPAIRDELWQQTSQNMGQIEGIEETVTGLKADIAQPRSLEQVVGISAKSKFVSPQVSIVLYLDMTMQRDSLLAGLFSFVLVELSLGT